MKKLMALILAVMLLLSLVACGEETTPAGTDEKPAGEASAEQNDSQTGDLEIVYLLASVERIPEPGYGSLKRNTMEYDENGNQSHRTTLEYEYTYSYDAENRLIGWKRLRKDGTVQEDRTYEYDANGREAKWSYVMGEYTFVYENTYDDQGNLVRVVCTRNGEAFSEETYAYDAEGRVTEYKGGEHLQYAYEGNRVVATIIEKNGDQYTDSVVEYDENGNLILEEEYFEGELTNKCTYTWGADGKLVSSTDWSSANEGERQLAYTYDENGCLTEVVVTEGQNLAYRKVYTYVQWQGDPQRAEELRAIEIDELWQ